MAEGLVFRLAVETTETGQVERVVFVALRGEEGQAECVWPIPLERPAEHGAPGVQLRLIADDGYEGPQTTVARIAKTAAPSVPKLRRRTF